MSYTSTMSLGYDSASSSQYLSSSQHSSLSQSKRGSSEISKTYKHASQLYLTRRLAESYNVLQHVVTPPGRNETETPDDEPTPLAPIALASTSQRIKIWSLYITLLNTVVELGPDEGKRDFGSKEYSTITRNVQNGEIWDQVVRDGYQGREGSVDAEVIYNLSNLLLGQAQDQAVNQSRLETYLSSSANPTLDISAHLNSSLNGRRSYMNGASTPKDLSSRIKIIELFTLHVLPRNNEWDYARTFINGSDVLDDERRDAFLQTLEELQIAKEQETGYTSVEEDYGQEPEMLEPTPIEEPYSEREAQAAVQGIDNISSHVADKKAASYRRSSSEIDYGIEERTDNVQNEVPTSTTTQSTINHDVSASTKPSLNPSSPPPKSILSQTPEAESSTPSRRQQPPSQKAVRKSTKSVAETKNPFLRQARHMMLLIRTLTANISSSLTGDPTALLRTMMFVCAFLILMSRRELRERIRRIMEKAWTKVRATVGMGVKVSYV